eukprot:8364671-Heterocapsa_arctica.AAC.1
MPRMGPILLRSTGQSHFCAFSASATSGEGRSAVCECSGMLCALRDRARAMASATCFLCSSET